jgi:predicted nucleic acid-binding protein
MILLDTNIVSEMLRENPDKNLLSWSEQQDGMPIYISMVTQAELLAGVAFLPVGKRRANLASLVEKALAEDFREHILLFDEPASRSYAIIAAERRSKGRPMSDTDCQIAAIARANRFKLATRNVRDFEHCGIDVENPFVV